LKIFEKTWREKRKKESEDRYWIPYEIFKKEENVFIREDTQSIVYRDYL